MDISDVPDVTGYGIDFDLIEQEDNKETNIEDSSIHREELDDPVSENLQQREVCCISTILSFQS